jgi:hypothetical protein
MYESEKHSSFLLKLINGEEKRYKTFVNSCVLNYGALRNHPKNSTMQNFLNSLPLAHAHFYSFSIPSPPSLSLLSYSILSCLFYSFRFCFFLSPSSPPLSQSQPSFSLSFNLSHSSFSLFVCLHFLLLFLFSSPYFLTSLLLSFLSFYLSFCFSISLHSLLLFTSLSFSIYLSLSLSKEACSKIT